LENKMARMADYTFTYNLPALGKVGQYQMSGIPYITASIPVNPGSSAPTEVGFPTVTRFVTVTNDATGSNKPLRVGFSSLGTTGSEYNDNGEDNYFVLNNGESYTGEWRVGSIYLLGASKPHVVGTPMLGSPSVTTASVIAGLTGIPQAALKDNWSGSSGVG
jgi:hypothetical protein